MRGDRTWDSAPGLAQSRLTARKTGFVRGAEHQSPAVGQHIPDQGVRTRGCPKSLAGGGVERSSAPHSLLRRVSFDSRRRRAVTGLCPPRQRNKSGGPPPLPRGIAGRSSDYMKAVTRCLGPQAAGTPWVPSTVGKRGRYADTACRCRRDPFAKVCFALGLFRCQKLRGSTVKSR